MGIPAKRAPTDITSLLRSYQAGDSTAFDQLLPLVYQQLKKIASNQMRGQGRSHTLCSTALVHETFLKLKESQGFNANDRAHFFAVAARTMRWLLADYARARKAGKRGGPIPNRVVFDENAHIPEAGIDLSALEEALVRLEQQEPRLCRVVELRHLVGLTVDETALIMGVAAITVKRDWMTAKAWLARELELDFEE